MTDTHSDAFVFFGATGDLAYKKIFPSLQAMVKRGTLNIPVVCVAKAGWNLDQLRARAFDSVEKHGGADPIAFEKLSGLLRYVDGDYNDPSTFTEIRKQLGSCERPAHFYSFLWKLWLELFSPPWSIPPWSRRNFRGYSQGFA